MIMKITTIIVILCSILRNKVCGQYGFDLFKLKPLLSQLGDKFLEENEESSSSGITRGLEYDVTCFGADFFTCYQSIQRVYEHKVQYDVANWINQHILLKLNSHNALVELLLKSIKKTGVEYQGDELTDLIDFLLFDDSNVYCVVNFLRLFGINPNDKLKDTIFFSNIKVYQISNLKLLRQLFSTHFKNYKKYLSLDPIHDDKKFKKKTAEEKIVALTNELIPQIRNYIKTFSSPFCETQLPKINEESWLWKKIQYSTLFSVKLHSGEGLLPWKDLKPLIDNDPPQPSLHGEGESPENTRTNLPPSVLLQRHLNYSLVDLWELTENTGVEADKLRRLHEYLNTLTTDTDEKDLAADHLAADHLAADQSAAEPDEALPKQEMEPLSEMLSQQVYHAQFDLIDRFYNDVVTTNDTYVTKVLFCRVLHVVSGVLTSYYNVIRHYKQDMIPDTCQMDIYFLRILDFGYEFEMFLVTLELYIDQLPLTLDENTVKDMYDILIDARARFIIHTFKMNNPIKSIRIIRNHLKDKRFHRDSNDFLYANYSAVEHCTELLDHVIAEFQLIIMNLVHMVEVKQIHA